MSTSKKFSSSLAWASLPLLALNAGWGCAAPDSDATEDAGVTISQDASGEPDAGGDDDAATSADATWPDAAAPDTVVGEGEELRSELPRKTDPEVTAESMTALYQGNSDFAFAMYQRLADEEGNLFFSPHSISTALAMTWAGARGETETQMASALRFRLDQASLHPAFNALDLALASRGQGVTDGDAFTLHLANALWAQRGFPVLVSFLDVLAESYDAGLRLVDFGADPETARATINGWVSDHTEARIPELLAAGTVDTSTVLVLTNAIYFKANWATPFPVEYTADRAFTRLDGSQATVPFMSHAFDALDVYQGTGFTAVELPYIGDEMAMLILLPDAGRFAEVEASLDTALVDAVVAGMERQSPRLILPKWSTQYDLSLKEQLAALGMPIAFGGGADFSGIDGSTDLFIDDVIHQANISVDEYGTEAAAATAVLMSRGLPEEIIADRPFIYLIRDVQTGAVLFVGRLVDPA